ncbi:MAG: PKD domain-containing protein, partial [Phaeodactylibacter sp.]|nr:PKD domain-containing protein [Phaeodactylibacter sp.]
MVDVLTLPVAGFVTNADAGCAPFSVQITPANPDADYDYVYTANGAQPSVSSLPDPTFIFSSPGTYQIVQEVTNAAGSVNDTLQVTVGASPDAAFNASVALGGSTLDLLNQSSGADTYTWDFGDGNGSSEDEPTHTYTEDGSYTILLIASSTCGADTVQQVVEVVTAPVPGFEASATAGCAPFTVDLTSTASANAATISYVAPGATPEASTDPNPSFTYDAPGDYEIIQTVTNAAGSTSDTLQVTAAGLPQADFAANYTIGDQSLTFSNNSTGANSYQWTFGDGNMSNEASPEHTYAGEGMYTVELVATNACGNDTIVQQVEIITAPTAGFTTESSAGCAPFTVTLTNAASANATSVTYTAIGAVPPVSTDPNPTFTFPTAGQYEIVQEVSNAAGTSSETIAITVGDLPEASFGASVAVGSTTLELVNDSQGGITYNWDFGDGNESAEMTPSHAYNMDGEYLVTLITSNACGADTAAQTVTVVTPPIAGISLDNTEGCLPFTVTPQSAASASAVTLDWSAPGASPEAATGTAPEFTYSLPGVYWIFLEAGNAAGTSLDSVMVEVLDLPTPGFGASISGFEVTFSNSSSNAVTYDWNFGDGNGSDETNPVHTYDAAGEYPVTLTSSNGCGAADTTIIIKIETPPPTADFVVETTDGCVPIEIAFNNTSVFGESYEWTFEGGNPATSAAEN